MMASCALALALAAALAAALAGDAAAQGGGGDTLHSQRHTAGSEMVYIHTKHYTYIREKCRVHTSLDIMPVLHNGHRRNNPDRTFYPGDALEYRTGMGVEGCSAVKSCPVEVPEGEGECTQPRVKCSYSRRGGCRPSGFEGLAGGGPASESGKATLPTDIYGPDESYRVAKRAYAMAEVTVILHGRLYTGYHTFVSESSFPVRVLDPGLSVTLSHSPLVDAEGHTAANLDGTYYVWDPINVVHEIGYAWKEERIGTIGATHTKAHGILDLVQERTCAEASCTLSAGGIRSYDPKPIAHEYAGGSSMYNSSCAVGATLDPGGQACSEYHARHTVSYTAAVHNMATGTPIRTGEARAHSVTNATGALVVRYDPQFGEPYAYVSLADAAREEGDWAWSKRHVMAVRYLGSEGGGRDDAGAGPHEMRRALLNALDHEGRARYLAGEVDIGEDLSWNATGGPSGRDAERCTPHDAGLVEGALRLGREPASAMFTQASYGRLYLEYPISGFMVASGADTATLRNTVLTQGFGGHELRELVSYSYTYPRARFAVPASVALVGSDGPASEGSVSAVIVPTAVAGGFGATEGPSYLHDRICESATLESGDAEIANMVVSDMYPREMRVGPGDAPRADYVLNKTGVSFTDVYALAADSVAELGSNAIYEAPSSYAFSYSAAHGGQERTRNLTAAVLFTSPIVEIANIDTDNALDYAVSCPLCAHTTLQARPRAAFGEIVSVEVNGEPRPAAPCSKAHGCTVSAVKGADNEVTLANAWGGTASATVFVARPDADEGLGIDVGAAMIGVAISVAALAAWRLARHLADAAGAR
ncbi:MAG: hypothetical protein OXU86_01395 [Thaumarchaeota archaeon]|nr:hypothetical protein [Nitrososphaerota archaeon]